MEEEKTNFVEPGTPTIIVKKLTDKIITEAVEAYLDDDGYWLKLYHLIPKLDIEEIDEILDRKEQEELELEAKMDAKYNSESEN